MTEAPVLPDTVIDPELVASIVVPCEFESTIVGERDCGRPADWICRSIDCLDHLTIDLLCADHRILVAKLMLAGYRPFSCNTCQHRCHRPRVNWEPLGR